MTVFNKGMSVLAGVGKDVRMKFEYLDKHYFLLSTGLI